MIKQTWNLSDEERSKILKLHESATKNLYLSSNKNILMEQIEPLTIDLTTTFPVGRSNFQNTREIDAAINQIKNFIKQNPKISNFTVTIESSESRIPQDVTGRLSRERAETMSNYLTGKLPSNTEIEIDDRGPQGPEFPGSPINEYRRWQYVRLIVSAISQSRCIEQEISSKGNKGSGPLFLSYDEDIDLSNMSRYIKFTLNCAYVPDFVRIIYNDEVRWQGWAGDNKDGSRLLVGTLLQNKSDLPEYLRQNAVFEPIKDINLDDANKLNNTFLTADPRSVNPFENAFPNLNYGADGKGLNIFRQNRNFKPFKVQSGFIRPQNFEYVLDRGTELQDSCKVQVISPFSQTYWDINYGCIEK